MKIDKLKKKLIKKAIILSATSLACGVLFTILYTTQSSLEEELKSLSRDSTNIVTETVSSTEKNKKIVQSIEIFKNLPTDKLTSVGLDDLISRIRDTRPLKQSLEDRYKLQNFSMSFSSIDDKEVSAQLKTKFLKVYSNNLEVEFQALTDEVALSFCNSIIKEASGYMSIASINLMKQNNITQEIINDASNSSKDFPSLVNAKIIFNWRTLGDATSETGGRI